MENKHWSSHLEFVVIFITILGGFYNLHSDMTSQIQAQSKRTDRLYEMFIDIVKERK